MQASHTQTFPLNETEIIQRIQGGEKALFEILIRRYNQLLYRMGRSYGFRHEDVEDLMQDTHVAAYLHLSQFENRSAYSTWIARIMINKCLYKRQKAGYRLEEPQDGVNPPPSDNVRPMFNSSNSYDTEKRVLNHESGMILEKCIEQLPLPYRTVFVLRELEGMSVAETAKVLAISASNVKVRLNRAKALLRKQLEEMYRSAPVYEFNLIYCDQIVDHIFQRIQDR